MVNSAFENNPLCVGRDCRYARRSGLSDSHEQARVVPTPRGTFEGSGKIMKKIAIVTVAVLGLSLAACNKNNADNNAANETAVETNAATDVNAASENATTAADNALNVAGNAVENAGNAVEKAQNAVSNTAENATH